MAKQETQFGGVPLKTLKAASREVHKLLKSKHFQPKGYVQLDNMPMKPVTPSDDNVEGPFHDGEVQLCLHYEKDPEHVADSWWISEFPQMTCNVYVVWKVSRSGKVSLRRYEVVAGFGSDLCWPKSAKTLGDAYEKSASRVNAFLDSLMKNVRC